MRPRVARYQVLAALSEVRLQGKHSGPYVQRREIRHRVNECY